MFSTDRFLLRLLTFSALIVLSIAICAYHGISGKKRITRLTDEMMENGHLTGRFWRVVKCKEGEITISKYGYSVNLACKNQLDCHPGDNVSFVARKGGGNSILWIPERMKFHGTSSLKFWISGIAVLISFLMCCRHLSVQRGSVGLTFRKRESSCPMD